MLARVIIAVIICIVPIAANACSPVPPPRDQIVHNVVTTGVMIRGRVVRDFNGAKRVSEIIRADKIYVGEGPPRDFVIYRSDFEFASRDGKPGKPVGALCGGIQPYGLGKIYDRMVLVPANQKYPRAPLGTWTAVEFYSFSTGLGLETLMAETKRNGRFREKPTCNKEFQDDRCLMRYYNYKL